LADRSVLITGASSGIGAACAERLARSGWKVFAGVRAEGAAPAGATELLLDVTNADAIGRAAEAVGGHLDGLVNNAGIGIAGPLEHMPLDVFRNQIEVNLTSQLAVTQACLPALRAARGRVVLMGSVSGRSALPFMGAYAVTKFGLEALADALRLELEPDGIEVAIVEPGTIATAIWTKPQPIADMLTPEAVERYGRRMAGFRSLAEARSKKAAPAEAVAKAVEHALTDEHPRTRYLVGRDAHIRATLERLPDRLRDRVIRRALLGG
jgi:NAD(P)-dependent dehydrogenase (short-subunit alcohol dehydrogenase family)